MLEENKVKIAYTVVERNKDGRKFWVRVGAAFVNRDGSLNVRLDAMPVNGELQIRDYQPREARESALRRAGGVMRRLVSLARPG